MASLYNLLGSVATDEGPEAVALLLRLPALPLFPLLGATESGCLERGPIYLGLCEGLLAAQIQGCRAMVELFGMYMIWFMYCSIL